jgi:hypothetical protein
LEEGARLKMNSKFKILGDPEDLCVTVGVLG